MTRALSPTRARALSQVRQVSLLDELGQVSHIFSDKTGTLTSNLMSFRRCYLCGVEYGVGETAIAKSLRAMAEDADRPPEVALSHRPNPNLHPNPNPDANPNPNPNPNPLTLTLTS